jgi:peptidoglycan/LPS O-acetylase OafA/YrhL
LLRFFLAIWVVIVHYDFLPTITKVSYERIDLPLYTYIRWFYEHQSEPVPIFWAISGAVFAIAYPVSGSFNFRRFLIARFARLVPLHWVMLLVLFIVTLIRYVWFQELNNSLNFVLVTTNILLIQNWFPVQIYSINGPTWSISVEVLTYLVFGLYRLARRNLLDLLIVAISVWLLFVTTTPSRLSPFLSIALFFISRRIFDSKCLSTKWLQGVTIASLIAAIGILRTFAPEHSMLAKAPFVAVIMVLVFTYVKRLYDPKILGDITYSIYLIHTPYMALLVLGMKLLHVDSHVTLTPTFFILYFVSLIAISLASFHYLENPARRFINAKYNKAPA